MNRRKKLWIALAALAVALVALALVFREQPPYEFLRGAKRVSTRITSAPSHNSATSLYVSSDSFQETCDGMAFELASKGWECSRTQCSLWTASDFAIIRVIPAETWIQDNELHGKTVVLVTTPPTTLHRFYAWLDDRLGR